MNLDARTSGVCTPVGFIHDVFCDAVGEERQVVIFGRAGTRWCNSLDIAGKAIDEIGHAGDVYFGCSLQSPNIALQEARRRAEQKGKRPPSRIEQTRGFATTAQAIGGVWLDIDIVGPGHKKKELPPTLEAALAIVERLPFPPTYVLHSGGGLQVWHLFKEPWLFGTEEERVSAERAVYGWQVLAGNLLRERGWDLDSTHDLARVLRPPGTINRKYGRPVELIRITDSRINPMDLEEYALEAPARGDSSKASFELRADAEPPPEKFRVLVEFHPKFAATWRGERKEFPSESEYEMSLASIAAEANWTDQEIADLVVAHRRLHRHDLLLDRHARVAVTIAKARKGVEGDAAWGRLDQRVGARCGDKPGTGLDRERILKDVSALLGIEILQIVRQLCDPPEYWLRLADGEITLGGVEKILIPRAFRAAVAAASGRVLPVFKQAKWEPVAQALLDACEDQDRGEASTAARLVSSWLSEYLEACPPLESRDQAIPNRAPFLWKDRVAVFRDSLQQWLEVHLGVRFRGDALPNKLGKGGCVAETVTWTKEDGRRTSRYVWLSPEAFDDYPIPQEVREAKEMTKRLNSEDKS